MKLPQPCSQTQQTSPRAAQPCRLMAAFFRERMGLRWLGAPRRASRMNGDSFATASLHAGLEIYNEELNGLFGPRFAHETRGPYHIKLRCYERNYTPTSPSAASTATDATSPSAGPSAIIKPKKTSHFANPFVSDDASAFTRFTSTRPDTA